MQLLDAKFAEIHEPASPLFTAGDTGADGNEPGQGKRGIDRHPLVMDMAGQCAKACGQGLCNSAETTRLALAAQAVVDEMGETVARIEPRVALTVEIEIHQKEPVAVKKNIVMIAIPLTGTGRAVRQAASQSRAGRKQLVDAV